MSASKSLKELAASSTTFQALVEVTSEARALKWIGIGSFGETAFSDRRRLLIEPPQSVVMNAMRAPFNACRVRMRFELPASKLDSMMADEEAVDKFADDVKNTISDMAINGSPNGGDGKARLIVTRITAGPVQRAHPEDRDSLGDYFTCTCDVDCGVRA